MSGFQYYFGLDLGLIRDFTAAVVAAKQDQDVYHIQSAHRFELRTAYTTIAREVATVLSQPPLAGKTALLIDATGVGQAVVSIFKEVNLSAPLYEITITGGEHVSRERDTFHVPKRDLAGVVQVAFEQGRVKIARDLPFAEVLRQELQNFTVKINAKTGNDTYEAWRENEHDDLVLATALALWGGGQKLKRTKMFEGETAPPVPTPLVMTRKIREGLSEIVVTPRSEEAYRKAAQEGWSWNQILYGGRKI